MNELNKTRVELNDMKLKSNRVHINRLSDEAKNVVISTAAEYGVSPHSAAFFIRNGLLEPERCKNCENYTDLIRGPQRYREFCSVKCKNTWLYANTDISARISNTVKQTAKKLLESGEKAKQIQKKLRTQEKNGTIIPRTQKSFYNQYVISVRHFTNKNDLTILEGFLLRGRSDLKENSYHLDHKFSIKQGFLNNVPAFIIGSIFNLEMIPHVENCTKQSKCSIELKDLLDLFYE